MALLRPPVPGDLGWILHRQAALYHQEHGWDWRFEGLVAEILAHFVANHQPSREAAWVAEHEGAIVGSVFLVQGDEPDIGKLRLLYVETSARGLGIGAALVDACIGRAREVGYRRLELWTNDILISARKIYISRGFALEGEERHHSFGQDLVGQFWGLDL